MSYFHPFLSEITFPSGRYTQNGRTETIYLYRIYFAKFGEKKVTKSSILRKVTILTFTDK